MAGIVFNSKMLKWAVEKKRLGYTYKEISEALDISIHIVKRYVSPIVSNRPKLKYPE